MKRILIALMITGFIYAQDFTNATIKPPVFLKQLSIALVSNYTVVDEVYDFEADTSIAPAYVDEKQGISYMIYLEDEDGKRTETIQGDLIPYITQAEIIELKAFLDKMVVKANRLIQ